MSAHRTIIATGPGTIRRLCCGTGRVADDASERFHAALDAIDDQVALVDGRPVAVDSLWRTVLQSVVCENPHAQKAIQVVHPSWWPSSRIDVVTAAAATLYGDVQQRPRSWFLRQVSNAQPEAPVVEIAERLVAISAGEVVAVPRGGDPDAIAEEVTRLLTEIDVGTAASVLIDAPGTVDGAQPLATLIAGKVWPSGQGAVEIDDARLSRLTASAIAKPQDESPRPPSAIDARHVRSRAGIRGGWAAAAVVLAATVPAMTAVGHRAASSMDAAPSTFLVEGRVALTVPATWRTERVVAGPGSARVQVTSPSDPEVALHITQSPIPDDTLSATADQLKRAMDTEPPGVFVDFNPSGVTAGRPAVTYREVRASHHVRWTVLVDGSVRISVGCQTRPGGEEVVRIPCERAVRSAHAIG